MRERDLPDGIEPRVVVEGRSIVLDREEEGHRLDNFAPQVMIFANGDLSSFEVALQREGAEQRARVYTDEQTNVRLLLPGEVEQKTPPVRTRGRAMSGACHGRTAQRGFTLLEVLIALAIVAMSAGALLGTITSSASNVSYLKDKTLAEWVALNRLTEIRIAQQMPDTGKRTGNAEMGGMRWQWEQEVTELPMVKGMFRIDVRARPTGETVDDSREPDKPTRAEGRRRRGQLAARPRNSTGPRR